MKKLILILMVMFLLTGCCMSHEWAGADCTTAKTCAKCGETEGEALGHSWTDATCTEAKTCAVCGVTEGEALGHDFADATCTAPMTCTACGVTEGEVTAHVWGKWEAAESGAQHGCTGCDLTETMSEEVWNIHQFIVGEWQGFAVGRLSGRNFSKLTEEEQAKFRITFHDDSSFEQICDFLKEKETTGYWESDAEKRNGDLVDTQYNLVNEADGTSIGRFMNGGNFKNIFYSRGLTQDHIALCIPYGTNDFIFVFYEKVA